MSRAFLDAKGITGQRSADEFARRAHRLLEMAADHPDRISRMVLPTSASRDQGLAALPELRTRERPCASS